MPIDDGAKTNKMGRLTLFYSYKLQVTRTLLKAVKKRKIYSITCTIKQQLGSLLLFKQCIWCKQPTTYK